MIDRKKLYEELWTFTDRNGILVHTQLELAAKLGMHYQRLSEIFSEWTKEGKMKKYRHQFQMKNPDSVTWEKRVRRRKAQVETLGVDAPTSPD